MTEPPETPAVETLAAPKPPSPEQVAKAERAKRLAQALRDNLRRRKAPRTGAGLVPKAN